MRRTQRQDAQVEIWLAQVNPPPIGPSLSMEFRTHVKKDRGLRFAICRNYCRYQICKNAPQELEQLETFFDWLEREIKKDGFSVEVLLLALATE